LHQRRLRLEPLPGCLHRPTPPPDRRQGGWPEDRGRAGAGPTADDQPHGGLEAKPGPARRRPRAATDQRPTGPEGDAEPARSGRRTSPEEILVNPATRTRRASASLPSLPTCPLGGWPLPAEG